MSKILIIPCSGIGKPVGSISRDAVFRVVDELRYGIADTFCLSMLVMGDEDTISLIRESLCITVDGCPLECSKKNIEQAGGKVEAHFRVMDTIRDNRGLKPQTVTFLDDNGRKLSEILAEKIVSKVDELRGDDN